MVNRSMLLVNMYSLNWDIVGVSRLTAISNAVAIPGLFFGGKLVRLLGTKGALTLGALSEALQHLLETVWVTKSWQQFAMVPFMLFRGTNTAATNALVLEAGQEVGLRPGELRAMIQGLHNIAEILGNVGWAALYTWCLRTDKLRRFFLGVSLCALLQYGCGMIGGLLPPPNRRTGRPRGAGGEDAGWEEGVESDGGNAALSLSSRSSTPPSDSSASDSSSSSDGSGALRPTERENSATNQLSWASVSTKATDVQDLEERLSFGSPQNKEHGVPKIPSEEGDTSASLGEGIKNASPRRGA